MDRYYKTFLFCTCLLVLRFKLSFTYSLNYITPIVCELYGLSIISTTWKVTYYIYMYYFLLTLVLQSVFAMVSSPVVVRRDVVGADDARCPSIRRRRQLGHGAIPAFRSPSPAAALLPRAAVSIVHSIFITFDSPGEGTLLYLALVLFLYQTR